MITARPARARLVAGPRDAVTRERVGGKAVRLRQLAQLGVPVPPWVVLTTAATEAILAPVRAAVAGLAASLDAEAVTGFAAAADRVAAHVRSAPWPGAVAGAFARAVGTLSAAQGFAVRSSAVCEDGVGESYAGVFRSLLGVRLEALETAVRECLAAAFAEPVASYRRAHGLHGEWPRFAVIVQQMVPAHAAGVAFTADPRSGELRQIVVAGYGLGEGVVSDLVETDSFERPPGSDRWVGAIRRKERRVVPDGSGGTTVAAVAPAEQEAPALTGEHLDRLGDVLGRVELAFGGPQDVEWAVDPGGALHVLQVRPIGTAQGDLTVWDDSNIGESYPGVTLPLTYSLVRRTYERLFTRALEQIGVPQPTLASLRPDLRHLIGVIRGHLYMNLLGYYRLFAAVPGIGWTVTKWEKALGIGTSFDLAAVRRGGRRHAVWRAATAVRVWWRLARRFWGLDAAVERFRADVDRMLARWPGQELDRWAFDRLFACYESLVSEFLDDWTILIFNDLFAFLFDDQLARLCGPSDGSPAGPSDLRQRLLAGLGGVESVRPLQDLRNLAAEARSVPTVAPLLWSDLPSDETWRRLATLDAATRFRARADEYLARHGDRTVEELKLETVTLSERPWTLVDLLRATAGDGGAPGDRAWNGRLPDDAAESEFRSRFAGRPIRRWYAARVLDRTRRCVAARENLSAARARAYGLLRRIARAIGTALVREGVLPAADDIFYATFEDLEAHARGGLPGAGLADLVAARAAAYRGYRGAEPEHRIVCRGSAYRLPAGARLPAAVPERDTVAGIPCSPGCATGIAHVVAGPASPDDVCGKILVARVTEPGWVFLMSVAKGVVVERGSILSHAAIIGRELGVPTIVGAAGATTAIGSGDEIAMDGSTGEVRVLRRATAP